MKKFQANKSLIIKLLGINLSLFSLVILLSNWAKWLSFLAKGFAFILGFVGFWILIPFFFILGLYIAFRKQLLKFRIGTSLIGLFLIIFAIGLISSHWATFNMQIEDSYGNILKEAGRLTNYTNSIEVFNTIFKTAFGSSKSKFICVNADFANSGVLASPLGGGFFCFIFLGLFNGSGANNKAIFLVIVSILLIILGICLVLNRLIAKGFSALKNKSNSPKEESADENLYLSQYAPKVEEKPLQREPINNIEENLSTIEETNNDDISEDEILNQTINSYNSSHGLQIAKFDFDTDEISISSESKQAPAITQEPQNNVVNHNPTSVQSSPITQPVFEESNPSNINEAINETAQNEHEDIVPDFDDELVNMAPSIEEPQPVTNNSVSPTPVVTQPISQPIIQNEPKPEPIKKPIVWEDDIDIKVDIPPYVPRGPYTFPNIDLLDSHENPEDVHKNDESCVEREDLLAKIFADLNIGASVVGHTIGPSVTSFDIQMNSNSSVAIFNKYINDISNRLGGYSCRFESVVAGKNTSSLEVPNVKRTSVGLYDSLKAFGDPNPEQADLTIPFGKDISGNVVKLSIADTPHMLVAGTTGSGKSVFIHSIILTLIMRNRPEDLKLVLIDPKGVEMSFYKKIPHLVCPMIVEPSKASVALSKLCDEMEKRNQIFRTAGVRELKEFNKIAQKNGWNKMPSIVVFVDEYADISEQCKDIQKHVQRIGQKARTAGIHLVIATQRPSTNIINGVIRANLPTHVALSVSSTQDSVVILGKGGAETLLGNGDMLVDSGKLCRNNFVRVQSCFADVPEINRVCEFLRSHYSPMYWDEYHDLTDHSKDIEQAENDAAFTPSQIQKNATDEQLYETVKSDIMHKPYCSISFIQRNYAVGFPKAGKIFARLQNEGIVDTVPESSAKGCRVLVRATDEQNEQGLGSIDQSETVQNFDPYNQ